jgi:hypothetical protein
MMGVVVRGQIGHGGKAMGQGLTANQLQGAVLPSALRYEES